MTGLTAAVKRFEDRVTICENHIERLHEMLIDSHDHQEPSGDYQLESNVKDNFKEECGKCPHQKCNTTAFSMEKTSQISLNYYCELGTKPDDPENCPTHRCENCYYKQALRELLDK